MKAVEGGASGQLLVVLTADEGCFERVRRLFGDRHVVALEWVSDPSQLRSVHGGGTRDSDQRTELRAIQERGCMSDPITGIVLDLTDPYRDGADRGRYLPPTAMTREEMLAWQIGAVLVVAREPTLPVLLLSDVPQVESALLWYDTLVVERVQHDEADVVWQRAIHHLVAEVEHTPVLGTQARSTRGTAGFQGVAPSEPPAPTFLTADLRFDSVRGLLIRSDGEIALTARESELLALLLHAPGRFYTADQLALRLSHSCPYPVSRQSVVQTVSDLRRKLGDSAHHPSTLVHRRGYGYAITVDRDASRHLPVDVLSLPVPIGLRV